MVDKNKPTVHGVGCIGVGEHKISLNGKKTKAYQVWSAMLFRCYDKKRLEKKKTYENCWVCDDWLNYQVFASWYYRQKNNSLKGYHLDKDFIKAGNKIYSPNMCCLLPTKVNLLFCGKVISGKPIGVTETKNGNYEVSYTKFVNGTNKRLHLGTYEDIVVAAEAYKVKKIEQVKETAEFYKDVLDERVYKNLVNFKY